MGEAADDVLDGLVCEGCGEWMSDVLDSSDDEPFTAPGYPRRCEGCSEPSAPPKPYRSKQRRRAGGSPPAARS